MADIIRVPHGFGSARDCESDRSIERDGRPWPTRTALLFWLAASGLVWLALSAFAVSIV